MLWFRNVAFYNCYVIKPIFFERDTISYRNCYLDKRLNLSGLSISNCFEEIDMNALPLVLYEYMLIFVY